MAQRGTARDRAGSGGDADGGASGTAESLASALLFPVTVARRVLPDRELPVYLGAGALAVAGILEWPVALAGGLGYAALKRWDRSRRPGGATSPPATRQR